VIRGEDHIPNTPKQILLYQACEFPLPRFGHLSMILGPTGQRLSKRDGATSVVEYKEAGFLPDGLLNYLARLGWSHGDQEIFTRDQMIALFSLEHVGKKSAIFDQEKLLWVNSVHMRESSAIMLSEYLDKYGMRTACGSWSPAVLLALLDLYKGRVKTVRELVQEIGSLAVCPTVYSSDDADIWLVPTSATYLRDLLQNLATLPTFEVDLITIAAKQVCQQHGIKLVQLAQPIRLALVGKTVSPGVFELMALLGAEETKKRLERCIAWIEAAER
jgi:glutamyl-tRNA synthetase